MKGAPPHPLTLGGRDCGSGKCSLKAFQEPLSRASLFIHLSFTHSIDRQMGKGPHVGLSSHQSSWGCKTPTRLNIPSGNVQSQLLGKR